MPRRNMPTPPKRAPKIDSRRDKKPKPCVFCAHNVTYVDYKDLGSLRKYVSDRGKIRGRRVSGNCQQHQRAVTDAIKTARELALLPYTQRTVTERRGGRGGRDDRGDRGPRGPRADRENEATLEGIEDFVLESSEELTVEVVADVAIEEAE
jgi:small subunit ribosomal protein S18